MNKALVLGVPSLEKNKNKNTKQKPHKTFCLFIAENQGNGTGILTQKLSPFYGQ